MNGKINIAEILRDCPKGTPLYSPMYGKVYLSSVNQDDSEPYPIRVRTDGFEVFLFTAYGLYVDGNEDAECILFPSKDQRDWTKFRAPRPELENGTPCMVARSYESPWELALCKSAAFMQVFGPSKIIERARDWFEYIVPCDKFDFKSPATNLKSPWNYGTKGGNL